MDRVRLYDEPELQDPDFKGWTITVRHDSEMGYAMQIPAGKIYANMNLREEIGRAASHLYDRTLYFEEHGVDILDLSPPLRR